MGYFQIPKTISAWLNLTDIAYANIVPFRYQHTDNIKGMEISFLQLQTIPCCNCSRRNHTIRKGLEDTIKSTVRKQDSGVERVTGDKRIIPESEEYLNAIANWVKQRMTAHDLSEFETIMFAALLWNWFKVDGQLG